MIQIAKTLFAALLITFCSWLSSKKPQLAGFIIALPLTTLMVTAFSYAEFKESEKSVEFAKSIFYSIPLSLTFFIPFLLAKKIKMPFWGMYFSGIILLVLSFLIHKSLFKESL